MFLTDWRRTRNCRVSQYEHEQMRPSWRRLAVSSYLFLSAVTWSGSHSSWLDGSHGIKTCFMAESRGWIYASHSLRKETALRSFGTLSQKKKKKKIKVPCSRFKQTIWKPYIAWKWVTTKLKTGCSSALVRCVTMRADCRSIAEL